MMKKLKGFTLVELLLVLIIIASIMVAAGRYFQQRADTMRIDRTVLQIEYILNAGLTYYVANGKWPGSVDSFYHTGLSNSSPLQPDYLPPQPIVSPWAAQSYWHGVLSYSYMNIPANTFQVWVYVGISERQQALANVIVGKLPFAYYTQSTDTLPGFVIAYVNIPSQNLNNAMAINFAGLYHHGACVPVPTCPNTTSNGGTTTTPQVFVIPVSVSGVNDPGSNNIYPISSFTAYSTAPDTTPTACTGGSADPCTPISGDAPVSGLYWRVCLQVITQRGDVQDTRAPADKWGNAVTLAAFTRCAVNNEPAGSDFTVYTH